MAMTVTYRILRLRFEKSLLAKTQSVADYSCVNELYLKISLRLLRTLCRHKLCFVTFFHNLYTKSETKDSGEIRKLTWYLD